MAESERIEAIKIAAAKALKQPFGAVIEIVPEGGGGFFIDGRASPPVMREKLPKGVTADCVWRAAEDVLARAFDSARGLESAYVSGRLSISGDMSVMARLNLDAAR